MFLSSRLNIKGGQVLDQRSFSPYVNNVESRGKEGEGWQEAIGKRGEPSWKCF